jgi:hypothetical protein
MTQQRDIERLLDHWFSDGPDQAPDRVVDIVTDRIERQSQRPAWRLQWRSSSVNAYAKIAVAAAAVLIVAVVGYNLLPGSSTGVGGPAPTASPSPTAAPTSTPVAIGSPSALPRGTLTGGRYSIQPFSDLPSLTIAADIPAGWEGFPTNGAFVKSFQDDLGVVIAFMKADGLFSDPCQWDLDGTGVYGQPGDVVVGPTVDDLVTALTANTSYTSTTPSPLTLGEFEGQELVIQVPLDIDMATCDRETGGPGKGLYYVFSGRWAGWYAQGPGPGYRWHLFIVDVGGTRLITAVGYYDGVTPQADVAAAQAIVESFEITP